MNNDADEQAAHWRRVGEVIESGGRPLAGPICRDCLRLIPRLNDGRWDVPAETFCRCGHFTTEEEDARAHGIIIGMASGSELRLILRAKVRE